MQRRLESSSSIRATISPMISALSHQPRDPWKDSSHYPKRKPSQSVRLPYNPKDPSRSSPTRQQHQLNSIPSPYHASPLGVLPTHPLRLHIRIIRLVVLRRLGRPKLRRRTAKWATPPHDRGNRQSDLHQPG